MLKISNGIQSSTKNILQNETGASQGAAKCSEALRNISSP